MFAALFGEKENVRLFFVLSMMFVVSCLILSQLYKACKHDDAKQALARLQDPSLKADELNHVDNV